jgi:AcrR family transcriptional regulator
MKTRGRPPGPTADFARHRRNILDAATALFAERGYESTGMRELAAAVDMSPPALYHYFESKEALMSALIEDSLRGPQGAVRALPAGGSLREVLLSAGAGFMAAMSTAAGRQRLEVVFLAAHHRGEWAEMYLSRLMDPTESGLAKAVAAALPAGATRHVEPRWVAKQLIGSLLAYVLHEEVLRREGASDPSRERYLKQVVEVIAAGVEQMARPRGRATSRRSRP